MSGPRSGVAKQLRDEELRGLYLHCHGYTLNLAAGDVIKRYKHTKDALDVAFETSKFVKFSPERTAKSEKLKEELTMELPGNYVLCTSRWTVCVASLK
ncbi:Zinc finger MYM-type protein 1-like [Oopsacas minuta]|uniref:Zinc finger MYM-type protein 1-like n=1 Tax=Oopsacas minuta TaxID=111878 RepID=A0AAV7KF17_9METZ|nr:Zinc finger MYM-type protein 1-like [Oopsacas minuta]